MADTHEKRTLFFQYAGHALATLDKAHPDPVTLTATKLVKALGQELTKTHFGLCERTLSWLADEGYFRCSRGTSDNPDVAETAFRGARLTTLGFASLNTTVAFHGEPQRVGDALRSVLRDQLKKAGDKARDAAVSEIVKQLISAAAKMFGGDAA